MNAAKAKLAELDGISLSPTLGNLTNDFVEFASRIERTLANLDDTDRKEAVSDFRQRLAPVRPDFTDELQLRFVQSVVLDLIAHGWSLRVKEDSVYIVPHDIDQHSTEELVRNSHLVGRDAQPRERSVREFVKGMERKRLFKNAWHNIFSVMRDGKDLVEKLAEVNRIEDTAAKIAAGEDHGMTICFAFWKCLKSYDVAFDLHSLGISTSHCIH